MLCAVYKTPGEEGRNVDAHIAYCVRGWTCLVSDNEGAFDVARALDIFFVLENKFASVRRIGVCLDAIGVPTVSEGQKFVDLNPNKSQVTSFLFCFWSSRVPKASLHGFIVCFFFYDPKIRCANFREVWTLDLISELDPLEAKKIAAFFFPDQALSPSGTAPRNALTAPVSSPADDP